MSIRIKTKLLCKQNFIGRCQTSGRWHRSLHREEAQCSLFIFVGWQSAWLSNKGKSPCPWEIIIKQRTTHSAQCAVCVNAGGEQVCWFNFWVMSTQQWKQGFSQSEVMTYCTLIGYHIAFQAIHQWQLFSDLLCIYVLYCICLWLPAALSLPPSLSLFAWTWAQFKRIVQHFSKYSYLQTVQEWNEKMSRLFGGVWIYQVSGCV